VVLEREEESIIGGGGKGEPQVQSPAARHIVNLAPKGAPKRRSSLWHYVLLRQESGAARGGLLSGGGGGGRGSRQRLSSTTSGSSNTYRSEQSRRQRYRARKFHFQGTDHDDNHIWCCGYTGFSLVSLLGGWRPMILRLLCLVLSISIAGSTTYNGSDTNWSTCVVERAHASELVVAPWRMMCFSSGEGTMCAQGINRHGLEPDQTCAHGCGDKQVRDMMLGQT
jgi:hypothetical protein